ncbi:hypothetical protein BJ996_006834 [Streptomyces phaeogriseichromatogenes]|nr:hypothetical protein [Streptomyces murinus]
MINASAHRALAAPALVPGHPHDGPGHPGDYR